MPTPDKPAHRPDPWAALRAAHHLAVVDGERVGWCLGVGPEPVVVGRADAALVLTDPRVSRHHLELRVRRGGVQARDLGSANGTTWRRPRRAARPAGGQLARPAGRVSHGRRRRLRPGRWVDLPVGSRLAVGPTVLEVRRRPHEVAGPPRAEPERRSRRDAVRWLVPLLLPLTMLPLLLTDGASPWRWLVLALPLVLVVVMLLARERPAATRPVAGDPAALLLTAAAAAPARPPGDELTVVLAPGNPRQVLRLARGERVAVLGAAEDAAGTVRWLAAQLLTHHRAVVTGPGDRPPAGGRPGGHWYVVVHDDPSGAPPPSDDGAVHLLAARQLAQVPAWCTRVVDAPGGAGVGPAWLRTVADLLTTRAPDGPPGEVLLRDLVDVSDVAASWAARGPGLSVPAGVDEDGPVEIDLVAQGPHALVAGTTGAGKSELLRSWLLALVVRHGPESLQLVLVDYKGGAAFGPLAGLPHTAGTLTDLDPAGTERALTSLRAELRRRERLLAAVGAADLAALARVRPGAAPPRLLVVVDEFRELAQTHPDVLAALVRLAAQGRSLGVHLVLATQRPAGAVSPEIRANLTVRVCLRVLEAADSQDVVGTPAAAGLPPVPGRAVVRTDRLRTLQAPWCGADGWAEGLVAAVAAAWGPTSAGPVPGRPWAPALPADVRREDLDAAAVAVTDLPEEQRLGTWTPGDEALLILGGPGTGRSQILRTLAAAALAGGRDVHLVGDPHLLDGLAGPTLGTFVPAGDPRRVARLLGLLLDSPPAAGPPALVLVDDAADVLDNLDLLGPGHGAELLGRLLRGARRHGLVPVVAGPASLGAARWAEGVRSRLVLAPRDDAEALLAGVPRHLVGGDAVPGRGVLVTPGTATAVQVARSGPLTGTATAGPARPAPPRLAALPSLVRLADLPAPRPGSIVLGLGGDDAGPVVATTAPGTALLVVGPPGSGRTTALQVAVRAAGGRASWLSPDDVTPPARPGLVVVDDLDRWPPAAVDRLEQLLLVRPDLAALASARPEAVVTAYRGPLATWRAAATMLLLRPAHPVVAQLVEADLSTAVDPHLTFHPGRGVLVERGAATPVQVALP